MKERGKQGGREERWRDGQREGEREGERDGGTGREGGKGESPALSSLPTPANTLVGLESASRGMLIPDTENPSTASDTSLQCLSGASLSGRGE